MAGDPQDSSFSNEQITQVIGERDLSNERLRNLDVLAGKVSESHWHVEDLPWDEVPVFPLPENPGRRLKAFVEFGKRAIKVQLAAEHVAVTAARHVLLCAEAEGMPLCVRRATAAVLNDEASHVLVMTELDVRAEEQFPEFPIPHSESPLLTTFREDIPNLHPVMVAGFLGSYEAMIALRGYAEQASYPRPSILGAVAGHAAADDARHAKVMRLVAHEWLDRFRKDGGASPEVFQKTILEPIRRFWDLLIQHERWLIHDDPRAEHTFQKRAEEDARIADRLLNLVEFSADEIRFIGLRDALNGR